MYKELTLLVLKESIMDALTVSCCFIVKFLWVRNLRMRYSELWCVLLYLLITCFCAVNMALDLFQPETV